MEVDLAAPWRGQTSLSTPHICLFYSHAGGGSCTAVPQYGPSPLAGATGLEEQDRALCRDGRSSTGTWLPKPTKNHQPVLEELSSCFIVQYPGTRM